MYDNTAWEYVSLSDPNTVRALLTFRRELDPTYRVNERHWLEAATDIANVNDNIHLTYMDLQQVMDKIRFTRKQEKYIKLMALGMDEYDIAKKFKIKNIELVCDVIDRICEAIASKNKELWSSWVRWDYTRTEYNYKRCSRCGEFKPKNGKYFRARSNAKDGLMYICRECE